MGARCKKVPHPSPPGGAPLGAPARGLQYGRLPTTGRAWIPRVKHNVWVRDSPKEWRQPRRRLNLSTPRQDGAAAAAKRDSQTARAQRQQKLYGWGVTVPAAPAPGRGAERKQGERAGARPAGGARQVPKQQQQGPNAVTRAAAARARGAFAAKSAKGRGGGAALPVATGVAGGAEAALEC